MNCCQGNQTQRLCLPFPRRFHQLFALTPFSALFSCPPQGEEQSDHGMARCIHTASIYSSLYKELVQRALQSSAKQEGFKETNTPNHSKQNSTINFSYSHHSCCLNPALQLITSVPVSTVGGKKKPAYKKNSMSMSLNISEEHKFNRLHQN